MRELRLWAAAAAGPVVAAGFYALAALRRRHSLHPTGIGYRGWLRVPIASAGPGLLLVRALRNGVRDPALAQQPPTGGVAVAPVGDQVGGPLARPTQP
jgi:hypothetical protein